MSPDHSTVVDDHFGKARSLALEHGWLTISLLQRRLKLGYRLAQSLVEEMENRGVVAPADATGRRLVRFENEPKIIVGEAAAEITTTLVDESELGLTLVPQTPLRYQFSGNGLEHETVLTPSPQRVDDSYSELIPESLEIVKNVLSRYFIGNTQHGMFEVLVQCVQLAPGAAFEVNAVNVVVQPEHVVVTQLPIFAVGKRTGDVVVS